MERFSYTARDPKGILRRGRLIASGLEGARQELFLQGFRSIELEPLGAGRTLKERLEASRAQRFWSLLGGLNISLAHQLSWVQRLSALLSSGLPLLQSLDLLQQQVPSVRLKNKLKELKTYIRDGHSFSSALSQVQPFFDDLGIHMVRAAEAQGALPEALQSLVQVWRKRLAYRRQLQNLLLYPCVVATVGLGVMGFLALWVLPRFERVFVSSFSISELPWLTRCVLALPRYSTLWVCLFLILCSAFSFFLWAPKHWGVRQRVLRCLPGGRASLYDHVVARLGSSLGALLDAGVPILQSLSLSAELLPAYCYKAALLKVRQHIQNGKSLSSSLQATQCFPEALIHVTQIGEASGRLPELLQALSQDASLALHARLTRALGFLEPILLLSLATLIGILALALFLPITQMLQSYGV